MTKHDQIQFAIDRRDVAYTDVERAKVSIRAATLDAQAFYGDGFKEWWAAQNFRRTDGEPLTIEDALQ
jgi:hypothetical protein